MMSSASSISIKLNQGTIIGKKLQLSDGQPYYTFRGIPYAKPPIGKLRFQPPLPLEKFPENVLDCTKERDVSLHKDLVTNEMIGSENCLFLNIYTKNVKSVNSLPVMVFIHGGAFMAGSGNSDIYLPTQLIMEDVIVVTINYRLGVLGFLYLPEGGIQGNLGLKDQLMALKWVKENIHHFNGDSNNITLFGQSAGAASTCFHLLSPLSRKYFHKTILQSGTCNMEWAFQKNPIDKARFLAKLLGCTSNDDKEIGQFLRDYDQTENFVTKLLNTLTPDERSRGLPIPFKPVIDDATINDETIVKGDPLTLLSELDSIEENIPVMMGYTSKEGISVLPGTLDKLDSINSNLTKMIPRNLIELTDDSRSKEIATKIRDFYFNGQPLTETFIDEFCNLLSDYHFVYDCQFLAEAFAKKYKPPVYFYRFSYDGNLNLFKFLLNFNHIKGACHSDELFYLFQTKFNEIPNKNSMDDLITKKMCRLWTNFAKFGNPTPNTNGDILNFKWNPVEKYNKQSKEFVLDYLEMNENFEMKTNPDKIRMDFWKNLFEKHNQNYLVSKL